MNRVAIVAEAYGLSLDEVSRWPGSVVAVFYRNAVNRGWLINNPTRLETTCP